jgi:alkanesulfonate monooxygenase SsuD/methylene tetrahydromethanopterin reductase-like flavin-dependent oxidoreductase (luciferase family)
MTSRPALRVDVLVVQNLPWQQWIDRVREVERLGYDGVWVWDHLVHRTQEPTDPLFEAFSLLGAAAALTSRVRLGTLVASPVLRSALLLAKSAMTVDQVSGGRFELGIGAGGSLLDSAALGLPVQPARELAERFEQTVELVDAVLRGGSSYDGTVVSGAGMVIAPGPVQSPRLPLVLAAHGPRTLGVAGRLADTWNTLTTQDLEPAEVLALAASRAAQLDQAARAAGRDPLAIRRSVLIGSVRWPALASTAAFREAVLRYAEVGFTDVVVMHPDHPAHVRAGHGEAEPDIVRRIAEDVLPGLRAELA